MCLTPASAVIKMPLPFGCSFRCLGTLFKEQTVFIKRLFFNLEKKLHGNDQPVGS